MMPSSPQPASDRFAGSHRPLRGLFISSGLRPPAIPQKDQSDYPRLHFLDDMLPRFGIAVDWLPLNTDWKNPLYHRHQLLGRIDPWRAITAWGCQAHYDFVFCIQQSAAYALAHLKRIGALRKPLVVLDPIFAPEYRLADHITTHVARASDAFLTLGHSQSEYIQSRWPQTLATYVGLGVDTEFFSPRAADCLPDAHYIFSPGEDGGRDFPCLMEAIRPTRLRLVIKASRYAISVPDDLKERVSLITEHISYLKFRQLYANALMVVIPAKNTHNVGGITVTHEALAMGRPLIASASTHLREHLNNAGCMSVPIGDTTALNHAINQVATEPGRAENMSLAGRAHAENNLSLEKVVERIAHAIHAVVAKDPHRPR